MNEDDTGHLIERHLLNATTHRIQQLIEGQVIDSKTHRRNLSTTEKSWMMTTRRYKLMFGFSGYCLHFIFSHDMAEGGSDLLLFLRKGMKTIYLHLICFSIKFCDL